MNTLSKVTGAIIHPVQTAGSVAGQALDAATAGVRTTTRVVAWATKHGRSGTHVDEASPAPATPGRSSARQATPAKAPEVRTEVAPDPRAPQAPAGKAAPAAPRAKATTPRTTATKAAPRKAAPAKAVPTKAAATKTTVPKKTATKAAAKKTAKKTAKKAPSARAATAGPALAMLAKEGEVPTEPTPAARPVDRKQPEAEPLLDPATVKAVKSEADTLSRAADPQKD